MGIDKKQTATANARFVAHAADAETAERLAAEAWDAGATGIEERESAGFVELIIYAPAATAIEVRAAVEALGCAAAIGAVVEVPDTDWSERWKQGLAAIEVSPRLQVRPSFVDARPAAGQAELVIDPGQAFGTGGHVSTLLVLQWIDELTAVLPAHPDVLDVGTGTGVLALAAIELSGATAVAFDLDPVATAAARQNAAINELSGPMRIFTGPLDALSDVQFDLVVANLLKNEMLPLARGIAAATRPGGRLVLSGLLADDALVVAPVFEAEGFTQVGERSGADSNGDLWVAPLMRR